MKSDRRGVASCGLEQRLLAAGYGNSYARENVPLVDMQIRRHVGGQTRGGRRASHGLQGEVVHARLLHAHVPEVEALGSQTVCSKQWFRGQIATVAPWTRDWRRVHGGEGRGHLHGCGGLSCLSCWAMWAIASVCGRTGSSLLNGGRRRAADKHTRTRKLIPI